MSNRITDDIKGIRTPSQLNSAVPGLARQLYSLNTTLAPVAGLLEVIGTLATDSDGTLSATPTDKRQLLPNLGGLINGLGGLTSAIPGVLSGITGAVPSVVPQVISGVAGAVPSLVHGVTSAIPSIVGGVTSALPGILDPLTSALPGGGLSSIGGLDNVSAVVHLVIDLLTSILNIVNQFSGISSRFFPAHEASI